MRSFARHLQRRPAASLKKNVLRGVSTRRGRHLLTAGFLVVLLAGCATAPKGPQLGKIYSQAAGHLEAERNPVIVIPGFLGSRLVDTDTQNVVWGAFGGGFADPSTPEGARLAALPMDEGTPLYHLRDSVSPDGALDTFRLSVWLFNFRLQAYYNILKALGVGGYRDQDIGTSGEVDYGDEHFTCFQFDYDWRLDLAANARRLDEFIAEKHSYVESEIERRFGRQPDTVKFDIVAHSMGGLLARYYLRYGASDLPEDGSPPEVTWAGARNVKSLSMIGTPNAGSVGALEQLVEGFGGMPFVPKYQPAILGTLPSLYQLLPQSRHGALVSLADPDGAYLDIYDPDLWVDMGWGLASLEQDHVLQMLLPHVDDESERRRIALNHQRKCLIRARKIWQALSTPADPPPGLTLNLFAGDAVETDAALGVDPERKTLHVVRKDPGDGTVTRSSALMDERVGGEWAPKLVSPVNWDQVMFFFRDHLGITKDAVFTDNLLYLLLEQPPRRR
jgi:pimeloyl-ACP methyl ester carboxylesterase